MTTVQADMLILVRIINVADKIGWVLAALATNVTPWPQQGNSVPYKTMRGCAGRKKMRSDVAELQQSRIAAEPRPAASPASIFQTQEVL
jgi:hypothetical protein